VSVFIELLSETIVIVVAMLPEEIIVPFIDGIETFALVPVVFELIKIILEKPQFGAELSH
jgi:hypothetical protein